MNEKIYIIIPTAKNRHETLFYSIKTVLNQDYDNLELVVSDNFSSSKTVEVVKSFSDHRIKYQRSAKFLNMMESCEFALSSISDPGFIHFMGDDNGLVPDALAKVNKFVKNYRVNIIHSDCIQYSWPDLKKKCFLDAYLTSEVYMVNSKKALKAAYNMHISFNRLPTIFQAFVHSSVINQARLINGGRYFAACVPDVYSALMNAFCVDKYIYSRSPLIINGRSVFSNGHISAQENNTSNFVNDNLNGGYVYHKLFPPTAEYYLGTYETFAVAADKTKFIDFQRDFNFKKLINKLINEQFIKNKMYYIENDILEFSRRVGVKCKIPKIPLKTFKESRSDDKSYFGYKSKKRFFINNIPDLIGNIYQVSLITKAILSNKSSNIFFWIDLKNFFKDKLIKILLGGESLKKYKNN